MNRSGIITISVLVAILSVVLLYILLRDQSTIQKHNETPAAVALLPDSEAESFTTLSGEPTSVADDFGSIIVVSTWASWCPQCAADFPKLAEIAREFKDKGVVVYAVNRGEDTYSAERYLATIDEPADITYILDASDFYFKNSGGYAMPETIIYNERGDIVLQQRGELRLDEVKQALQTLTE